MKRLEDKGYIKVEKRKEKCNEEFVVMEIQGLPLSIAVREIGFLDNKDRLNVKPMLELDPISEPTDEHPLLLNIEN